MATISENLVKLAEIKSDLKSAITEKGQTVNDDFSTYAEAVRKISGGGGGDDPDYNFLLYAGSNNGAYFDTGYTPTVDTRIQFDGVMNVDTGNMFIGTGFEDDENDWRYFVYSGSTECFDWGNSRIELWDFFDLGNRIQRELGNYYIKNRGEGNYQDTIPSLGTIKCLQPNNGVNENGYFYSIKIYEGDVMTRDFAPAQRKSDGKYGFVNLLDRSFIPSENGDFNLIDAGSLTITENGTYDVTNYTKVIVNVQ